MSAPDEGGGAGEDRDADAGALVDLVRTTDLSLLAILKSALEGAGIPFAVQGEEGLHQIPIGSFGLGFFRRVMGAVIRVPKEREEEAKAFLASFETDPPRLDEAWKSEGMEEEGIEDDDNEESEAPPPSPDEDA